MHPNPAIQRIVADGGGQDMTRAHSPTLYQRGIMALTCVIALWIGVMAVSAPVQILETMQLAATGPAGINETRGQYGGFFLALALFLGLGVVGYIRPAAVLMVMLVLYGGVFCGRMIHLILTGFSDISDYSTTMKAIHLIDLTGLIASAIGLRQASDKRAPCRALFSLNL